VAQEKVAQAKKAKKQTIAQIKKKKKAVTKTVAIQVDGEIANQIAALRSLHSAARDADRHSNTPETAPKIQKQIDNLVEESQDTLVVFTFKSVGRLNYDELVAQHPPTTEAKKEGADFNADTFPPALISAACTDPEIPIEDAIEMFDDPDWNNAELRALFFGALEVNTETGEIPLSRSGSDGSLSSLLNSLTQSNMGSPTASI
jgi:hypothetical protein